MALVFESGTPSAVLILLIGAVSSRRADHWVWDKKGSTVTLFPVLLFSFFYLPSIPISRFSVFRQHHHGENNFGTSDMVTQPIFANPFQTRVSDSGFPFDQPLFGSIWISLQTIAGLLNCAMEWCLNWALWLMGLFNNIFNQISAQVLIFPFSLLLNTMFLARRNFDLKKWLLLSGWNWRALLWVWPTRRHSNVQNVLNYLVR